MGVERNKQLAMRFFDELVAQRFDQVAALMADDLVCWDPVWGNYSKQGFIDGAVRFLEHCRDGHKSTVHGITAEGNRVAIETETYAELDNGRVYNNTFHWVMVFENDQITVLKEYHNTKHQHEISDSLSGFHHSGELENAPPKG